MARCCTAAVARAPRSGWVGNGDSHWSLQRGKKTDVELADRRTDVSSTFLGDNEVNVGLTRCGGEGGWPRAAGVNGRQGWHGGTGEATGG